MTEKTILEEGAPVVDTDQPHHIFAVTATGYTAIMDTRIPASGPAILARFSGEEGVDPLANVGGTHMRTDIEDPWLLDIQAKMRSKAYWDPQHPDHFVVKNEVMRAFRDGVEE